MAADGLAQLLELHRAELVRFLRARCGDAAEADDLMQDIWLKLDGTSAGPVSNGRAYLFRIANNLVLDRRRGQLRAMRRDHAWLDADGFASVQPEERSDPAPLADEELARRQEAAIVQQAIATLPAGAQRALRLHRLEGHSQGEVAEIMGISRSGVEKHLAVAMKHLRIAFAGCGPSRAAASRQQGQTGGGIPQPEKQP
jgi:RNA polymerase sigma factor (sigma-70 family)